MDSLLQLVRTWVEWLQPYPLLQALLIIVGFLLLAGLADRLITGIIARMVSRTETDLDDRVLSILHRPVFTTVALIGLLIAADRIELSSEASLVTTSIVKTLLILIWLAFALRFSRLMLDRYRVKIDFADFFAHESS